MPGLTDQFGRRLAEFLASAAPPYDLAGHYDSYAPEARLLVGAMVVSKRSLTRPDYVRHWRSLLDSLQESEHGAALALVSVLRWAQDPGGWRVLATVAVGGETLLAAFRLDPGGAVLGCCLLPDGDWPEPESLMARCLAELADRGRHPHHAVWPLTGLSAAYHRLQAAEPLPLVSLPESRFTCADRGDCCRMGTWQIPVDPNGVSALQAVAWEALGTEAPAFGPPDAHGVPCLQMGPDGDCPAHTDGACAVHRVIGWQPLHACRIYPFQFTATPDSIVVTASFQCLTVGENAGQPLQSQSANLRQRLAPVRHQITVIPPHVPLRPAGPTLSWAAYKAVEATLLEGLADRARGDLRERVRHLSGSVAALIGDPGGEGAEPVGPERAESLMARLCDGSVWDQPTRRPFDGWTAEGWRLGGSEPLGGRRDDELATRYLRTLVFRKLGLGLFGVAFVWGLAVWVACLWDRHTVFLSRSRARPIDRALQLETSRALDHSLIHTPLLGALGEDPAILAALCDPLTWRSLAEV